MPHNSTTLDANHGLLSLRLHNIRRDQYR